MPVIGETFAVLGTISGTSVVADVCQQIGEALAADCSLRSNDAYQGYSATAAVRIWLRDVDTTLIERTILVRQPGSGVPSVTVDMEIPVASAQLEAPDLERISGDVVGNEVPSGKRRYYAPRTKWVTGGGNVMPTVHDILKQTGLSDDQIGGLDRKVLTGFSGVLTEASREREQAEVARRSNAEFYDQQIAPALNNWGSEKSNLEAQIAYYKAQNEAARSAGFIPEDPSSPAPPPAPVNISMAVALSAAMKKVI